jgi:hypothetical protein
MSAAAQTTIFGFRVKVDPKILVGVLVVIAALLFWYNSRSDEEPSAPVAAVRRETPAAPRTASKLRVYSRRGATTNEHNTLRLRPIDATRGDVDPTLRLDMLTRLQFVKPEEGGRSLFEIGPAPLTPEQKQLLEQAPKLTPKTPPVVTPVNTTPVVNIPLKYYGFAKSGEKGAGDRGLFLDGDNVLVASEGEVVKQHYLVVELTANSARLEDVQLKRGQTLPVVPVATNP